MSRNNIYFTFGVATQMDIARADFDGILGLGRKYLLTTKKYSLLDTIKTNGIVSSTKFSLKYDYNTEALTFYIGEQHEDFKKNNVASCKLIESDSYDTRLWLCDLYSFGIRRGDDIIKRISIDCEGLFDTGTNNLMFPLETLKSLESTFQDFGCFIYEEGDNSISMKAVYCRIENNLPKITFGVKNYILTLGKSNFYDKLYFNNEYIYRLRLLFVEDSDICVIGQNFFYEYHTLFDDDNSVLKFYNDDEGSIIPYKEKTRIKVWVIVLIIVGGIIILGCMAFIIIFFVCRRRRNYTSLNKGLLEMSSIQKLNDTEEQNDETAFNQIMNINVKSNKKFGSNKRNKIEQNKN